MTELHPRAKDLIRLAKSAQASCTSVQEPSAEQLGEVMEGFQRRAGERSLASVSRLHGNRRAGRNDPIVPKNRLNRAYAPSSWFETFAHHYRRGLLKWSLLAAIMTGSLGAFANWGPRRWREDLGQLADRVGQSLGELVVTVTGREASSKASVRSGTSRPDAVQPITRDRSVPSETAPQTSGSSIALSSGAISGGAISGGAISNGAISNSANVNPRASTSGLDPRAAPAATPPRFAAPKPANLVSKINGTEADRSRVASETVHPDTTRSETAAASPDSAASAAHRASMSTPSTVRGPSAFSEAEVNLIAAARSALASGNYAQTRRLLDEHRTTFPTGALSEERETLRALVACRESGNTDLAQRYVTRRPHSLFAPRLIRECGLSTTSPPAPADSPNNIP